MTIESRNYQGKAAIYDKDYYLVRDFLINLKQPNFHYARWDWMISHNYLDDKLIPLIQLWFNKDELVAVLTFDTIIETSFILTKPDYYYLKNEMIQHFTTHFLPKGAVGIVIPDDDVLFQTLATTHGYIASSDKESDAFYDIIDPSQIHYTLPDGFTISSIKENYNLYQYGKVMWKGFNHELNGEGPYNPSVVDMQRIERLMNRVNINLNLKLAVLSPNQQFVSYCGMWYDPVSNIALVEPVATDPNYRMLGLGKVAVLEGIKRCGLLGAKKAQVGSNQQFYYNIGFKPRTTATIWKMKNRK